MAELDARTASPSRGCGGRDNFRLRIEQLEDALAGGHRGLQNVVLVAQVLDGPEEALRILDERDQHAEGDGVPQHSEAAEPDDQRDGDGS